MARRDSQVAPRKPRPRPPGRKRPPAPRSATVALSPRPSPSALLDLQRLVGNAAVTNLVVQRFVELPPPPPAPALTLPQEDPRFAAARHDLAGTARRAKAHPPAEAEARAAQDAAPAPTNDVPAQAEAARAASMAAGRPGGFNQAAFVAAVRAAVLRNAPQNLEEADKFQGTQVRETVVGQVATAKEGANRDIATRTAEPPDPSVAVEKPVTPLPPQPPPPGLAPPNPALVTPQPAPAEVTDLRGHASETHAVMAEAELTDEQLAESNEPQFTGALALKRESEEHTATAPEEVRAAEATRLAATTAGAGMAGTTAVAGMGGVHETTRSATAIVRSDTSAADRQVREALNAELRPIFTETKQDVEKILSGLDDQVAERFDTGEKAARAAWTSAYEARFRRWKVDRYLRQPGGAALFLLDLLTRPPEVNQFYQQAMPVYEQKMTEVISGIGDLIADELGKAKDRIAQGRARIEQIVASKPAAEQRVAAEAAAEFNREFTALEQSVDQKAQALVDDVAQRYLAAKESINEEITRLQEENKGWWDKAKDALVGVAETVMRLKDMLLNTLARAGEAVGMIIARPVRFLGNLVSAVKDGVTGFAANIWDHLKTGLKQWLLGTLAEGGIQLPDKFDLRGILQLVLSILNLTWSAIRSRIAKVIPPPVLERLEQTFEIVRVLATEGVPGLWRMVLEKAGDIKDMVLSQIKSFVVEKIIKAGVVWLVSLLNPASAFVKACKAIYDIVMFFVRKGAAIKSLVDAVLDSVVSIARGSGGGVAKLVENALARSLPVVIGFLASLLGLGGLPAKIRSALDTVREPVTAAIDWVIAKIVAAGKSLWSRIRGEDDRSPVERRAALDRAMAEGQTILADERATTTGIRTQLADIRKTNKVKQLDLIVDAEAEESITVHIVGANSPTVHGPAITRIRPPHLQLAIDEEVTDRSQQAVLEISQTRKVGVANPELVARYEQAANERLPEVIELTLAAERSTKGRTRLAQLAVEFKALRTEVGDAVLTPQQRSRANHILREARGLARPDFGNLQRKVMRRLRADPDLQAIESQLVAAGDAEINRTGTLRIKVVRADGTEVFEPLNLEHRIRLSDNPWLAKDSRNLILTDAPQNQQHLEDLRQYGSIWPTDEVESFVVRHQLNSQGINYSPGSG